MSIRICIVEDDEVIRKGFTQILANVEGLELMGGFGSAEAFMEVVSLVSPDVVLMDIQLPGKSGISCVRDLKFVFPQMQFLICSVLDDTDNIFEALCAGANGYLLKSSDTSTLINSIKQIYNGESPMSGIIARKVIANFQKPHQKNEYIKLLSDREHEILELLAKGYRYKEIADKIFLSVETVRTHIRNVYDKLQVSSRTDALNKVFPK